MRFWQAIVWADDLTGSVGSSFIDGDFGPNTNTHTRNWQRNKSIGVDGIVGRQTWTKAHGAVNRSTSHDTSTHTGYFYYGWNRAFGLRQHKTNATWQFLNPRTNTWTGTGH
ncbi:peptidoglycan-binding protein [Micromonospora sp. NPDC049374]|uniref:peptidoglycan-binding domain-containing protein n=1 Tax=Micromonospora sp. NPDC049374 TaxID=3154352 RepID=UPI00341609F3